MRSLNFIKIGSLWAELFKIIIISITIKNTLYLSFVKYLSINVFSARNSELVWLRDVIQLSRGFEVEQENWPRETLYVRETNFLEQRHFFFFVHFQAWLLFKGKTFWVMCKFQTHSEGSFSFFLSKSYFLSEWIFRYFQDSFRDELFVKRCDSGLCFFNVLFLDKTRSDSLMLLLRWTFLLLLRWIFAMNNEIPCFTSSETNKLFISNHSPINAQGKSTVEKIDALCCASRNKTY